MGEVKGGGGHPLILVALPTFKQLPVLRCTPGFSVVVFLNCCSLKKKNVTQSCVTLVFSITSCCFMDPATECKNKLQALI